jgi:signal transduction histidine kinase/ActR/RegA family two-component response regulator
MDGRGVTGPPGAAPIDEAAGTAARWSALGVALLGALILALVMPVANEPWTPMPAFVPAYQSAVAVNDLVTATLLFGLFRELRRPALLWLAAGYLLTTPLVVAHTLSFPGLFGPGSLIGGAQTTVWLWWAWHTAFPLAALAYALRVGHGDTAADGGRRALAIAVGAPLLVAALLIGLATWGRGILPPLLEGNAYLPGVTRPVLAVPLVLALGALALLTARTRLRNALDLWLAVALGAWAVEIFLGAVWNSGRFQAGFYVARLFGLFASSTVLVSLLLATVATHGRLARVMTRERDLARAALGESEARYRSLFDSIDAGFAIIELAFDAHGEALDYRFVEVNAAFARHTGLPDAQGRWVTEVVPNLERRWFDTYGRIAREGEPARFEDRSDALDRWFDVYAFRVGPAGDARVALLFTDISPRREAELALAAMQAELRRLNEGLEARVAAEVAAREVAQRELAQAQRMEALGHLAGGIAHDVNNVLQVVGAGASLIERKAEDPEAVRRMARMVGDAVERGSAVTRRLLAFARRGDLRATVLDPAPLLEDLRDILAHTLGQGIEVWVEAEAGLPPVLADKAQLETVLINLAANGRDAMEGQGRITLAAASGAPDGQGGWALAGDGGFVRLSVADTGAGMTPQVLARATEPFFTTKAFGKGTGLGLAMARGFAEQSGGGLSIESAAGQGTTVSLWLPVADEGAPAAAPPGEAGPARARRILLVDDDAMVREVLAEGLEAAGYAVETVLGGQEALARLEGGAVVDLLVSDLSMPGMDGLATIRAAQRRRPGLRAILLTGFATDVAAGGGASYTLLRKPITAAELARQAALAMSGAAEAARQSA